MYKIVSLFMHLLGSAQVCGEPRIDGFAYLEDAAVACSPATEHICTVDEWPAGWDVAVCCSPDPLLGCRFEPAGVCAPGESAACGFIPQPDPEPWVCNPTGTDTVYINDAAACEVGELHVCTHGDTPPDPLVLVCCDANGCRFEPGDGACSVGEWLACSHAG